jgi:hypothetical protein
MTWKAVILIRKDDEVYEVNSIYGSLPEFAEKMSAIADGVVEEVRLRLIDYPTLLALYQKSAARKPWRIDCKYCGGSGQREPTGEAHRAAGLMECDQCEPLPVRLVKWEPGDGP